MKPSNWIPIILIFITSIVYYYFGYELDRNNFYEILTGFSIAFIAYVLILKQVKFSELKYFQVLAILLRLVLLFSIPSLSDDYYRFIWDGQLLVHGLNPFDYYPADVTIEFPNKETLLAGMNSSEYYSIYPPIAQLVYYLGALFSPYSILGSIVTMRSIIILAEIGTIIILSQLLKSLKLNPLNSLWYSLNPLVIIELTGNLHFEAIMIFFLATAIYLLVSNRKIAGGIAWAVSAGAKLIPLVFLPVLFRKYKLKELILIYGVVLISFMLFWLPSYNSQFFSHFTESFQLYFKSFEFNASLYYIVRWVGFEVTGYNVIEIAGQYMPKIALLLIVLIQLKKSNRNWLKALESIFFALCIYYLFAFIVHPWYICTLVLLGVFTRYKFAVLWSFLAVLSYWAYQTLAYQENLYLIAIEYLVVAGVFAFEFFKQKEILKLDTKIAV